MAMPKIPTRAKLRRVQRKLCSRFSLAAPQSSINLFFCASIPPPIVAVFQFLPFLFFLLVDAPHCKTTALFGVYSRLSMARSVEEFHDHFQIFFFKWRKKYIFSINSWITTTTKIKIKITISENKQISYYTIVSKIPFSKYPLIFH